MKTELAARQEQWEKLYHGEIEQQQSFADQSKQQHEELARRQQELLQQQSAAAAAQAELMREKRKQKPAVRNWKPGGPSSNRCENRCKRGRPKSKS